MTEPNTEYRELVARLRATFDSGRTRTLKWRRAQLDAMQRMLEENEDAIVKALHDDLAKPAQEVVLGETSLVFSEIRHARSRIERWSRPRKVPTPRRTAGSQLHPARSAGRRADHRRQHQLRSHPVLPGCWRSWCRSI